MPRNNFDSLRIKYLNDKCFNLQKKNFDFEFNLQELNDKIKELQNENAELYQRIEALEALEKSTPKKSIPEFIYNHLFPEGKFKLLNADDITVEDWDIYQDAVMEEEEKEEKEPTFNTKEEWERIRKLIERVRKIKVPKKKKVTA